MATTATEALIALGANLPHAGHTPTETLSGAISQLSAAGLTIRSVSRIYATPCFPAGAGPDYVNGAVRVLADGWTPQAILRLLLEIELQFGRERVRRWGMRTLDLDLLAMGDLVLPDAPLQTEWRQLSPEAQISATPDQLVLPHPRLQDRAFVLVPLADVAPDWRHPLLGLTVTEMRDALPAAQLAEVVAL